MLFFLFVLGLAIGSFLNVLIDRLPREESPFKGRSYCERCKKQLSWHDLIPLFSFVFLKGKCRYCHSPISWYYPTVELVTGVVFVLVSLFIFGNESEFSIFHFPFSITNFQFSIFNFQSNLNFQLGKIQTLIYYLFIVSSLIVVFFTDLKYGIIPDKIVYPAISISFLYLLLNTYYLIPNIATATGAFLFFLLLYIVTRGRGMGFGDVKFVFLLGLFLGWPAIIIALYFSFLTGAFVGCILILWRKKRFHGATLPFGPFLAAGAFISLFWGLLW